MKPYFRHHILTSRNMKDPLLHCCVLVFAYKKKPNPLHSRSIYTKHYLLLTVNSVAASAIIWGTFCCISIDIVRTFKTIVMLTWFWSLTFRVPESTWLSSDAIPKDATVNQSLISYHYFAYIVSEFCCNHINSMQNVVLKKEDKFLF